METRASKKRANTIQQPPQVMVPKRQRVVLGEFSDLNLPDFDYQPTQKLQCRKNPNLKNSATTIPSLDSNLNKPVHTKINAKRDNQHIIQPYVSDISDYLRTMEVISLLDKLLFFLLKSICYFIYNFWVFKFIY